MRRFTWPNRADIPYAVSCAILLAVALLWWFGAFKTHDRFRWGMADDLKPGDVRVWLPADLVDSAHPTVTRAEALVSVLVLVGSAERGEAHFEVDDNTPHDGLVVYPLVADYQQKTVKHAPDAAGEYVGVSVDKETASRLVKASSH